MSYDIFDELFGPYAAKAENGTLSISMLNRSKGEIPNSEFGKTPIRDVTFTPETSYYK